MVDPGVFHLDHKDRGSIGSHLFVEVVRSRAFENDYGILVEHVALEQRYGLIRIARNDSTDHTVHALEVDGPLAAVQEVVGFGFCGVVRTLADHLFERIHQVVPVGFVDVAGYADHVAVFTQIADVSA